MKDEAVQVRACLEGAADVGNGADFEHKREIIAAR